MRDGEMTLKEEDLLNFPIKKICDDTLVQKLLSMEDECLVVKKNAGKNNENVKFPENVRRELNEFLDIPKKIEDIHKNCLFS